MVLSLSLSLSRSPIPKTLTVSTLVFLLCLCTGIIVGSYIKKHIEDTNAASSNITVADNNQVLTADQGTTTITRTSTVTVLDPEATIGYKLSAQISQNTIPPASTVSIYSTSSTTCTQSSPCMLNTSSPVQILETTTNTATGTSGHTTDWAVTITLPSTTPLGNYILDIAYSEEGKYPRQCPILQGKTYLQDITPGTLSTHGTDRERVVIKDRRNNQDYYVQNIVNEDGSCIAWMETNLRYAGDGNWNSAWSYPDDRYATTTTLAASTANPNDNTRPLIMTTSGYMGNTTTSTEAYTVAGVKDAGGSTDYTNTAASGGFYGYLYNWCAAMGGQPNACNNTTGTPQSNFDTTTSICPAGWRLPTGGSGGEFKALNDAVNGGAVDADAGLRNNFLAVYSGRYYSSNLDYQGVTSLYWSSTVYRVASSYSLYSLSAELYFNTSDGKNNGLAVRCVM